MHHGDFLLDFLSSFLSLALLLGLMPSTFFLHEKIAISVVMPFSSFTPNISTCGLWFGIF
jgi:hypothetical protein